MIANRYSVDREIGRGGMGAVWLGHDEVLGRAVALKRIGRLPGGDGDGEDDLRRAEREARIAASLNHPHVVAVFDLVDEGDHQWLVMEYVEGRSLAQVVRDDGPLSPDRAATILADAAGALAAAHAEGVVHRDVKPSNILLTAVGEAKLLDFGIARAQGDLTLTQTGLVSGSPAYLSPEVASGRQATTASDVWSLGATLFHLLTGAPPYDVGDNIVGGLYRIVHQEPPTVDDAGWLAPLLAATMVREPDHRWSMPRVAAFLEAGPTQGGEATRVVRSPLAGADGATPPTTVIPAGAAGAPGAPASAEVAVGDPAPGSSGSRRDQDRTTRSRRGPLLLGGVVLLLLLAIGFVLLQPDDQPPAPSGAPSVAPVSPPDDSTSESPSASESPEGPTARGIREFIEGYLSTAASDSRAAYAMLTPTFQSASGGLEGYQSFWDEVASVDDVEIIEADPRTQTVRYTYRYSTLDGRTISDEVQLQLDYDASAGSYRISSEG